MSDDAIINSIQERMGERIHNLETLMKAGLIPGLMDSMERKVQEGRIKEIKLWVRILEEYK